MLPTNLEMVTRRAAISAGVIVSMITTILGIGGLRGVDDVNI